VLDDTKLERALPIHEAAYRLLLWLGTAIERGFIAAGTAHDYVSDAEAASDWIAEHFDNIPQECRPASRSGVDLEWFANYFASFLRSSFDFHASPGTRMVFSHGPQCFYCGYHVQGAPHLKPTKVTGADRRRAHSRKAAVLDAMAAAGAATLTDAARDRLLRDEAMREDLATVAYAVLLVERCEGRSADVSALALWRQLAWKGTAPRRGYRLTLAAIRASESRVREAVALTRPGTS
jgi:hypothetical protein